MKILYGIIPLLAATASLAQENSWQCNCPEIRPTSCLDLVNTWSSSTWNNNTWENSTWENSTMENNTWTNVDWKVVTLYDGVKVMCDMDTDGGGWIVMQRRVNGSVDFDRKWYDYKYGFGDLNGGDFWMGLEWIHQYSVKRPCELRIDMEYEGKVYYAGYSLFRVLGADTNYTLQIDNYFGDAGDSMGILANNSQFSTRDRDNDIHNYSCAVSFRSAWWYANCHRSNLNGQWMSKKFAQGLNWKSITDYYDSLTKTEMKFRPVN